MPQHHLYFPLEVTREVERRARALGLPVSGYLAQIVRKQVMDDWPEGFFAEVVGGWEGEPLTRDPEGTLERRDGRGPALTSQDNTRPEQV